MPQLFVVIPAAGHSRRMGQPKLLMDWAGQTVIARVLKALQTMRPAGGVIVVRKDDLTLQQEIDRCETSISWFTAEQDPPDMLTSIRYGLEQIHHCFHPQDNDGWVLMPADHPVVSPDMLANLLQVWQQQQPQILIPTHAGKRGHPALFRWSWSRQINQIPEDQGLNWLIRHHPDALTTAELPFPEILQDLDTPDDYARLHPPKKHLR